MKKVLVVLLALAMVVTLLAAFPIATFADGEGTTPVWSGKANIKWYVDAIAANPDENTFRLSTAEDLAGLAYLVNASIQGREGDTCYDGLWYDAETGDVLGFETSGFEPQNCFNYTLSGFYIPADTSKFNTTNGQYEPDFAADAVTTIDGSAYCAGDIFKYKTVYLESDIVLNEGNAADWATTAPANVWMAIGGTRMGGNFAGFCGNFEGEGHTVSGLYFDAPETKATKVGLFGYTGSAGNSGSISNLTVTNCYLVGVNQVAALIGRTTAGMTITNCHVKDCFAKGEASIGGMVGAVHGGSIMLEQCGVTNVYVEGQKSISTFVSDVNFCGCSFADCFVTGTVKSYEVVTTDGEGNEKRTGGWDVGAFVGRIGQGSIGIARSFSDVTIIQEATEGNTAYSPSAGIVYGALAKNGGTGKPFGDTGLTISNCYYVDGKIQANGTIVEFPQTVPIMENQLIGNKALRALKGFDFENVWTVVEDGIPALRNAGKAHQHDFSEEAWVDEVAPTCTEEGELGHYECSCGLYFDAEQNEIEDLYIAPLGHDFGEWVDEIPATETEDGVKGHKHCANCGKDFDADGKVIGNVTIPATGHNYTWVQEVAATKTEDGVKAHYHCDICGKDFDSTKKEIAQADLVIPATGADDPADNPDNPAPAKKGCFGIIAGVPFIGAIVLGTVLIMKKKEKESK